MSSECFKDRLVEYISAEGIELNTRSRPPKFNCVSGQHEDVRASCCAYEKCVYCPVCGFKGDIYVLAGAIYGIDFLSDLVLIKDKIREALGAPRMPPPPKSKTETKRTAPEPVRLTLIESRKIYTFERFRGLAKSYRTHPGNPIKAWPYFDAGGSVVMADVRYESDRGKSIFTIWYDGKHLRAASPPHMMYGLNKLRERPVTPVVVVEGCKTADALARAVPEFISVTWNGGTGRVAKIDWSILENRSVAIFPDDDEPGMLAAKKINEILPRAKIIPPFERARDIKKRGADIVEILEIVSPDELREYILEHAV